MYNAAAFLASTGPGVQQVGQPQQQQQQQQQQMQPQQTGYPGQQQQTLSAMPPQPTGYMSYQQTGFPGQQLQQQQFQPQQTPQFQQQQQMPMQYQATGQPGGLQGYPSQQRIPPVPQLPTGLSSFSPQPQQTFSPPPQQQQQQQHKKTKSQAKIPTIRLSFITAADQAKFEQLFKAAVGEGQALSGKWDLQKACVPPLWVLTSD